MVAGYQQAKTVELQQRSSSVATQQTTVSSVPSHPSTTGVRHTHTHSHSLTLTHTLTHTLSLSLSLWPPSSCAHRKPCVPSTITARPTATRFPSKTATSSWTSRPSTRAGCTARCSAAARPACCPPTTWRPSEEGGGGVTPSRLRDLPVNTSDHMNDLWEPNALYIQQR